MEKKLFIINIILFSMLFLLIIGMFIYFYYEFNGLNDKLDSIEYKVDRNYDASQDINLKIFNLLESMRDYNKAINENIFSSFNDLRDKINDIKDMSEDGFDDLIDDLKRVKKELEEYILIY